MELTWITNNPKSVKSLWPRRFGVEYIEGAPKATDIYSVEELRAQNIIGVYANISKDTYNKLPLIKSPKYDLIDLNIYQETCCDQCNEIAHYHIDCPACNKKYSPTTQYGEIEPFCGCYLIECEECETKFITKDFYSREWMQMDKELNKQHEI